MRNVCLILVLPAVLACGSDAPGPRDSATGTPATDSPVAADPIPAASNWDPAAGPVLLIAGDRPEQVIVVSAEMDGFIEPESLDVSDLVGSTAVLMSRAGATSTVTLGPETSTAVASCNSWPVLTAPEGTARWRIGFLDAAVQPIATDSVQGLPSRDSSDLVSRVARLASGLDAHRTGDLAASFQGLPFVVTDVRRFTHGDIGVMVAHVIRRVNQEANPLEEHTLLIAERRGPGAAWAVARAERWAGREEMVTRVDLLAVVRLGGQPLIVLTRDSNASLRYVVQWRGDGTWERRWESGISRC
ncbi:MAG: hypothetical protein H0X64_03665 [Gemmatimonadaceae bacterium]|nr:hypothetical protein [Gemmatimonadaceae bacterium]